MKKTLLLSTCYGFYLLFSISNAAHPAEKEPPSLSASEIASRVYQKYESQINKIQSAFSAREDAYKAMGSKPFNDRSASLPYFAGYLWLVEHGVNVASEEAAIVLEYHHRKSRLPMRPTSHESPTPQRAISIDAHQDQDYYYKERTDHSGDVGRRAALTAAGALDSVRDSFNKSRGQTMRQRESSVAAGLAARAFKQSAPGHQQRTRGKKMEE